MARIHRSPRDHAEDGFIFALTERLHWKSAPDDDLAHQAELLAAQWQNRWAVGVRRRAEERYGSVLAYATATGQSYRRIITVINGTVPARLDDLASAVRHLGGPDERFAGEARAE